MTKSNNKILNLNDKKNFILYLGLFTSLTFLSITCEAAENASIEMVKNVTETLINVIKKEVRYGLEIVAALVGGWHAAKSSTLQPLIMGTGAAGMIEVLFQVIK